MATVFIEDLKVDTIIGVCDWEQHVEQTLHFTIEMEADIGSAAQTDDLSKTIDYAQVAQDLESFVQQQRDKLLETLVEKLLDHLMQRHTAIAELMITVRKPQAIAQAACAGLRVSRTRA